MIKILIAAGIGGTLPTLCRLAAAYGAGASPPFGVQVCVAIGLFFVIGMAVAFGLGESELKKAFVLGIAGPAIVTSTISSVTQAKPASTSPATAGVTQGQQPATGALTRLLGISEAAAQSVHATAASSFPQQPALLHVTSNVTASNGYPIDPIELQFFSSTGALLGNAVVDARSVFTVTVPSGAQAVTVSIDGRTTRIPLPSDAFASADLSLNIDTSHVSDFLWALGSNKRVRVEGVSATLRSVIPADLPAPAK